VFTKGYVFGIFVVSTFFDITYTILDFQMQVMARDIYTTPESYTQFMGYCGQSINLVSLFVSLLLTSVLIRRFGVQFCLVLFPIAVAALIVTVYLSPGLWSLFIGVVLLKGLNYALNNPTKEILYIPTSRDIRVKAKSWIDAFGTRSAKATGAVINNMFRDSVSALLAYGSLFSLAFTGIWIVAAAHVGRTFNRMTGETAPELDLPLSDANSEADDGLPSFAVEAE
jgi:AAA family ATP:ADP antiporter